MSTGCFFVTPFNYSAGYPAGYRISGRIPDIRQNRLAGNPAAGYPANSVSGATLISGNIGWVVPNSYMMLDLKKIILLLSFIDFIQTSSLSDFEKRPLINMAL